MTIADGSGRVRRRGARPAPRGHCRAADPAERARRRPARDRRGKGVGPAGDARGPDSTQRPASLLRDHPGSRSSATVRRRRCSAASRRAQRPRPRRARPSEAGIGARAPHLGGVASRACTTPPVPRRAPVRAVLTGWTRPVGCRRPSRCWPRGASRTPVDPRGRRAQHGRERIAHAADRPRSRRRRRVTVVTSAWHVRAPYFFAPYRASGSSWTYDPPVRCEAGPHLLAEELGGLAGMARQRRSAMGAVRLPGRCPDPRRASCAATPRAHASMAGQSRASRRSVRRVLRALRARRSCRDRAGTRPPNITFSRAPSCAARRSAKGGMGAVGCSSGAPQRAAAEQPDRHAPAGRAHVATREAPGRRAASGWRRRRCRARRRRQPDRSSDLGGRPRLGGAAGLAASPRRCARRSPRWRSAWSRRPIRTGMATVS